MSDTPIAAPAGRRLQLNAHAIKIIAVMSMFIDHIGAAILENMLPGLMYSESVYLSVFNVYIVMRLIGRIAFPIYCFLIAEGFAHTRNVGKYALRLGIFALISEIPFDLAFDRIPFCRDGFNVYFTLMLGVLALWGMDSAKKKFFNEGTAKGKFIAIFLSLLAVGAASGVAQLIYTDYAAAGVITIVIMHSLREKRMLAMGLGVLWLAVSVGPVELCALFALIPIYFYDGTRGRQNKYFFYAFYPVHLILLYLIGSALGL